MIVATSSPKTERTEEATTQWGEYWVMIGFLSAQQWIEIFACFSVREYL
jgi:hypothetical protein